MENDKTRFKDYSHALEYDRKAAKSDIRAQLVPKLVEALDFRGNDYVLDLATGTGRFARHHRRGDAALLPRLRDECHRQPGAAGRA